MRRDGTLAAVRIMVILPLRCDPRSCPARAAGGAKSSCGDAPDVSALASSEPGKLAVLVWHYHDDDVPGPDAEVNLAVRGLPDSAGNVRVQQYRIDADHSNAYTLWNHMGGPQSPTAEQYKQLEKAGQLTRMDAPAMQRTPDGAIAIHFSLPRQGVSLLLFDLGHPRASH